MNVARSTFVRRGYLLTALAVAVLLAGFSGTASAQERSFTLSITSSAVVEEGASSSASTRDRTKLTITRSDPTYPHSYDHDNDGTTPNRTIQRSVFSTVFAVPLTATCNGEPVSATNDDCHFSVVEVTEGTPDDLSGLSTSGSASVSFDVATATVGGEPTIERTIELLVGHDGDNGDWNEETVVLTVGDVTLAATSVLGDVAYSFDPARSPTSTLTIRDDDPMPTLKFTPPGIQLAKGNTQTMKVGVGVGAGGRGSLPDDGTANIRATLSALNGARTGGGAGSSDAILLSVSPPEAVGNLIAIWKDDGDGEMQPTERIEPDGQGRYSIGTIGAGATGSSPTDEQLANGAVSSDGMNDGIALMITAIDVSGFRDEEITFTLEDGRTEAQKAGDGGAIEDANPATVTILSGEATPTVTFSKASVSIDEGDSETVHLLADSNQGDQVGSAAVSVSGDARIALEQNGSAISGGTVSFDGSANAELTIRALGDESLEDGEEKTATVTITDASGANIGDPRELTVTVTGSTAVPVLPLVGQLLLALLLTAGGARLYRRRQQ